MASSPAIMGDFLRLLGRLRSSRYDLVLDLQGLFRSGFLTWATRAPFRLGFREAREGAWMFYTHWLPTTPEDVHAVDRYYSSARLLGFTDTPIEFPLPVPDSARRSVMRMLEDGSSMLPRRVVFAPGARWETKRWPASRFAQVMDDLTSQGAQCILVGGSEEGVVCRQITGLCQMEPINLAGRTSLPELVAVIDYADAVVCHDSAVAHLAAALGRPVVCITGPTNPARTGPYRQGAIVRLSLECSPCYYRKLRQCPHDHRCMAELGADAVTDAVVRALGGSGQGQSIQTSQAAAHPGDETVGTL